MPGVFKRFFRAVAIKLKNVQTENLNDWARRTYFTPFSTPSLVFPSAGFSVPGCGTRDDVESLDRPEELMLGEEKWVSKKSLVAHRSLVIARDRACRAGKIDMIFSSNPSGWQDALKDQGQHRMHVTLSKGRPRFVEGEFKAV